MGLGKKIRAALAGVGMAGALAVSAATPAAAGGVGTLAYPTCQTFQWWPATGEGGWVRIPDLNQNYRCQLAYGNQNSGVWALQVALDRCYAAGLETDGIYGPLTRQAVRNVQARIGAVVDGEYGPQTGSLMDWPLEFGDGYACWPSSTWVIKPW